MDVVRIGGNQAFWAAKRLFDVLMSVLLLPVLGVVALLLLIVNPALTPDRCFFSKAGLGSMVDILPSSNSGPCEPRM
ncbi:MAG: hypothetical protein P8N14_09945 [Sulfitobacter sp.]|nr:hypothetical protein [Sulfitobacter sp.]